MVATPVSANSKNIDEDQGMGPLGNGGSSDNDEAMDDVEGVSAELSTQEKEEMDLQSAKKRCRFLREANPVTTSNSFQTLASIASSVQSEVAEVESVPAETTS